MLALYEFPLPSSSLHGYRCTDATVFGHPLSVRCHWRLFASLTTAYVLFMSVTICMQMDLSYAAALVETVICVAHQRCSQDRRGCQTRIPVQHSNPARADEFAPTGTQWLTLAGLSPTRTTACNTCAVAFRRLYPDTVVAGRRACPTPCMTPVDKAWVFVGIRCCSHALRAAASAWLCTACGLPKSLASLAFGSVFFVLLLMADCGSYIMRTPNSFSLLSEREVFRGGPQWKVALLSRPPETTPRRDTGVTNKRPNSRSARPGATVLPRVTAVNSEVTIVVTRAPLRLCRTEA